MTYLEQLANLTGQRRPAIEAARERTVAELDRAATITKHFDADSTALIVTGSAGRGEMSPGSDFDWFFLVDGPSNPQHHIQRLAIADALRDAGFKQPGQDGAFAHLISSHELVHHVAGSRDTNDNLTRRILLLLESKAIFGNDVRERVIRNVLARYIIHDKPIKRVPVPHFLLNDIVRYWRTIASDFASKMWERGGEGWAIRNLKLRFSRKLLFASGLLIAFAPSLYSSEGGLDADQSDEQYYTLMSAFVAEHTRSTPLERLARALLDRRDLEEAVIGSYDRFLSMLSNEGRRRDLSTLTMEQAKDDPFYNEIREVSGAFRKGMDALFFGEGTPLGNLTREQGVF